VSRLKSLEEWADSYIGRDLKGDLRGSVMSWAREEGDKTVILRLSNGDCCHRRIPDRLLLREDKIMYNKNDIPTLKKLSPHLTKRKKVYSTWQSLKPLTILEPITLEVRLPHQPTASLVEL